jgi:hypothetical protein
MSSLIEKIVTTIFNFILGCFAVVYGLFSNNHEGEVYTWLHDNGVDSVLDYLAGGFIAFVSMAKLTSTPIDVHGIFESIVYYTGGIGTLIWIFFRAKLTWIEYNNKKMEYKIKEQELKSKQMDVQLKQEIIDASKLNK